jgi:hypothetical protein
VPLHRCCEQPQTAIPTSRPSRQALVSGAACGHGSPRATPTAGAGKQPRAHNGPSSPPTGEDETAIRVIIELQAKPGKRTELSDLPEVSRQPRQAVRHTSASPGSHGPDRRCPSSSAAGASVTVVGSGAPRFGRGSAVAASTSTATAVTFWRTDSLATAGVANCPPPQKRRRRGVLLLRHRDPAPSERAVWNNFLSRSSASARHTPLPRLNHPAALPDAQAAVTSPADCALESRPRRATMLT